MAKCPHCKNEVVLKSNRRDTDRNEVVREVYGTLKKEVMYSCPHCENVVGFGFFFGGLATGRP